ncbi:hypothetical protein JST97_11590 [bacterium]|nr:hypothetical protein [bacterium]
MEPTEQLSLHSELEKLAEGLESRDFHFMGTCATKALHLLSPPVVTGDPQALEKEATGTDWLHEASKTVKALENKDHNLAAMCLRKAVKAYRALPEPPARASLKGDAAEALKLLEQLATAIHGQEWTSAADKVRRLNEAIAELRS